MDDDNSDIISSLTELYDIVENDEDSVLEEDSPLVHNLKSIDQRYTDATIIAQGGMKTISKVFDQKTARFIAMAKLHADTPSELHEPFLREARLTALLDHPNIISIYNIGLDEEELPFFTMELETGQSFKELINTAHSSNTPLAKSELNKLLEVFLKICDAVSFAHSQNVVHLDLKPDNIQTGEHGQVIVCDWGLGKVLGNSDYDGGDFDRILLNPDLLNHMTLADEVRGTPGFMAPEQIMPEAEVSPKTDIYALGGILYAILSGLSPIEVQDDLDEVLKQTVAGNITPPDQRCPEKQISNALSAVSMKALQLDSEKRYETVEDIRNDVSNYMTGYSTTAQNAGFFTEAKLFFNRNRTVCLVIILAFTLIASLTTYFVNGLRESTRKAEQAQAQAEDNQRLAENEKERAEKILSLYKEEQKSISSLVEEHFGALKEEVYILTDHKIYDDPAEAFDKSISTLNRMISINPKDLWPYMQRGYVYYLMQDLHKANASFSQHNYRAEHHHELTKKYLPYAKEGELLDVEILCKLLKDLSQGSNVQALIFMLYDAQKRASIQDHSLVVKTVLEKFNKQWQKPIFEYDSERQSLKLSGKGLSQINATGRTFNLIKQPKQKSISILRTLKLKHLDLSGSEIYKVSQLTELELESLDISHTLINDCSTLHKLQPQLKKLTISKGQLKKSDPVWKNKKLKILIK